MNDSNPNDVTQDLQARPQESNSAAKHPQRISRYRIEKVLGQGGFGIVYLAQDEQLNRPVAVKVPHATLISKPEDAEMYLTEARTVANLDHPDRSQLAGLISGPLDRLGRCTRCEFRELEMGELYRNSGRRMAGIVSNDFGRMGERRKAS